MYMTIATLSAFFTLLFTILSLIVWKTISDSAFEVGDGD